jgi:hypothetical protein
VKLLSRYSILLSCLLLALPVLSGPSYAQSTDGITESKVLALLDSVDKATKKGNVAGMMVVLAKDAKITMTFPNPPVGDPRVLVFNKEQYALSTKLAISHRIEYEYSRNNARVTISKDRKTAMVISDVYESDVTANGARAVTSELDILSLRDGKILITSIEALVRFY